jgi:thioredoxin-like negative regulator of GroEL
MNAITRRQKIETMLSAEPTDQFLRYALAMELEKEGQHEQSLDLFRGLMQDGTPHVPSFLMAAQQLARQDRIEEARSVLRVGVEEARRQGNAHAAGEMSELLSSLGNA